MSNATETPFSPASTLRAVLAPKVREIVRAAIGEGPRNICLIDPPSHSNVGDSAILLGELDLLAAEFPESRITFFDLRGYSPAAEPIIDQADVILLHGGGNFGDLYPLHHELRLRILERFRGKRTIQLPQSIHFGTDKEVQRTSNLISEHKNFILLSRDKYSEEFARKHFDCDIELCPDMAFAMNPIRPRAPDVDFFCLLREDKERVADHPAILRAVAEIGSVRSGDWIERQMQVPHRMDRLATKLTARAPGAMQWLRPGKLALRRLVAQSHVDRGVALLSGGRQIVTDRLHAHVLAGLLGLPTIVFDSYDGKVAALYETWSWRDKTARFVRSLEEFSDALADLNRANPGSREASAT